MWLFLLWVWISWSGSDLGFENGGEEEEKLGEMRRFVMGG